MSAFPLVPPDELRGRLDAARNSIRDNGVLDPAYLTMNALAAVVACYGLLEDSAAVVIGAMVIATLLGPITGIALALVDGDNGLLRKALLAEASGMLLVLCIAIAVGAIHRDAPLTREILSRTTPTLYDLIIALAAGAAGAYSCALPRLGAGLVGVAIATALVPPLAACGVCLGRGEIGLGGGALLLCVTNLVGIQFASSVVLWLCGFNKTVVRSEPGRSVLVRNAWSFGIMLALGSGLSLHAFQMVTNHVFEAQTRRKLIQALQSYPGAELTGLRFQRATDKVILTAEIEPQQPFGPDKVAALEKQLAKPGGANLELLVFTTLTHKATRKGYLHEPSQPGLAGQAEQDR